MITLFYSFFYNKLETDRVLGSQPWSFDKHLVAIQWYEIWMLVRELCFDRISFWVHVYDIPVRFMNRVIAKGICLGIGEVRSSEPLVMEEGDYMRV